MTPDYSIQFMAHMTDDVVSFLWRLKISNFFYHTYFESLNGKTLNIALLVSKTGNQYNMQTIYLSYISSAHASSVYIA